MKKPLSTAAVIVALSAFGGAAEASPFRAVASSSSASATEIEDERPADALIAAARAVRTLGRWVGVLPSAVDACIETERSADAERRETRSTKRADKPADDATAKMALQPLFF